jgi:hypothetical protein
MRPMARLYCSAPYTGFNSGQQCSKRDAGRRATGNRSLERAYISSSSAFNTLFKRCVSEKLQK